MRLLPNHFYRLSKSQSLKRCLSVDNKLTLNQSTQGLYTGVHASLHVKCHCLFMLLYMWVVIVCACFFICELSSSVHASLHVNCHRLCILLYMWIVIVCVCFFIFELLLSDHLCKIQSSNFLPSILERVVWHCKHADTGDIRKAICNSNWERSFANKDVDEMVNIFNETISNVLNNCIPHETIICDDQDPPWINNKVKKAIQEKNQLFSRVK